MYLEINKTKQTFLIFFLLILFGSSISIFAKNNSNGNKNIFLDTDQDGLSDQEEVVYGTDPKNPDSDGDGYSDGTEVKSGYDPLKPAPGDKIVDNNKKVKIGNREGETNLVSDIDLKNKDNKDNNLTEELSVKLATAIADNDQESKGVTMDEINSMIDESVSDNMTFDDLPKVDKSKIKIKKQKYSKFSKEKRERKIKKDNEEYLTTVSYLMINNLPYKISKPDDINGFTKEITTKISSLMSVSNTPEAVDYFKNIGKKGANALKQLQEVEVPEDLVETHIKGIQILTYAIKLSSVTTIDHSDPIKSIFALGKVQNLLTLMSDFSSEINSKLADLGLSFGDINI
ncbi:MAG TPA: hypothetical protein ENJ27_00365 [Candidatus Moranbacteria bacterium]|nr:hypothetical protein [Candidatus Moranbacteria bacterium]